MSLTREPVVGGRVYRLRVDEILDELDADDAEILRGWLADPKVSPGRICRELDGEGIVCSENAVRKWRTRYVAL